MRELRLVYSDDGAQSLLHVQLGRVKASLAAWVEMVLAAPVDAYVWTTAYPDVCLHHSMVCEGLGGRPGQTYPNSEIWLQARARKELANQGTDALHVVAELTHSLDRLFIAGVRLSETRQRQGPGYPADPWFPEFTHQHPEFRLQDSHGGLDVALDFQYQQVRDQRVALIKELATKYPIDGIELDFARGVRHFPLPASTKQVHQMNMFIAEVREVLDKATEERGCPEPLLLGVRVPATLAECRPLGLDVPFWLKGQWLDYMVPTQPFHADANLPLDDYLKHVRASKCRLLAALQPASSDPAGPAPQRYQQAYPLELAEFKAVAANAVAAGAHGFHACHFTSELPWRRDGLIEALRVIGDGRRRNKRPHRYQFFFNEDRELDATRTIEPPESRHFTPEDVNQPKTFTFLAASAAPPLVVDGLLAFRIFNAAPSDTWSCKLNGHELSKEALTIEFHTACPSLILGLDLPSHQYFEIALGPLTMADQNQLEVTATHLEPALAAPRRLEMLELLVQN